MEVYILDSLYRRTAVVDRFESLIWTERWDEIGDFNLKIPSTPVNRSIFSADVKVALNQSRRVMVVETVEDNTAEDGRTLLNVTGRSLEKILDDRAARPDQSTTDALPKWLLTGTPDVIANTMFNTVCVAGGVDIKDIIALVQAGTSYPTETIPFVTESITWEQEPASLLSALQDICKLYEMGFRLYRDDDKGRLYFDVYTGNDRTTQQRVLNPVIFTPELDTVQNTTRLLTIEKAKNVAYVMNEQGFRIVTAPDVDPNTDLSSLIRRVLVVTPAKLTLEDANGNSVDPTPAQIQAYLLREGKYALAEHRALLAFDGEINQRSPYKYGRDYELGDLVEMRDRDGTGNNMRVTEQIFVSDAEGDRSYPTLTVDSFIIPGTWDSWIGNRQWADFGATEYWNTQP